MFRTPRESLESSRHEVSLLKPSVGRPPTPPSKARSATIVSSRKTLDLQSNTKNGITQSKRIPTSRKVSEKISTKSNASILNFFKKVDSPIKDDPIFVSDSSQPFYTPLQPRSRADDSDITLAILHQDEDSLEFDDSPRSVKRRKIETELTYTNENSSHSSRDITMSKKIESKSEISRVTFTQNKPKVKRKGPFLSDSDTDDNSDEPESRQMISLPSSDANIDISRPSNLSLTSSRDIKLDETPIQELDDIPTEIGLKFEDEEVPLEKESFKRKVSLSSNSLRQENKIDDFNLQPDQSDSSPKNSSRWIDKWDSFDDADFQDDDPLDGEESIGRRFVEEQARLEIEDKDDENQRRLDNDPQQSPNLTVCPICDVKLIGISAEMASRHVNGCLDGNLVQYETDPATSKYSSSGPGKKPVRKSALPRPGQASPFDLVITGSSPVTAFSKLMTGKAEDAAWTSAASSERSSKGKPAYQRTCPFYKIIPGFSICVDAFRYGAVQGCVAYFLSHFHSDHYIGLTSSWINGPIYCSKVTANLVKQQLRVDPKYVVPLEFEKSYEVQDTQGVTVSMISANHCPGSSLFLFEKQVSKGAPARIQRILHCGDFRACPAHITHPLLMPDVVDSVTGKLKQQKIDVCYLDTTYLNSRYAFPPQKQVIQACADMCLSLKKERAEEDDAWETIKRERAVSKYFKSGITKPELQSIAPFCGSDKTRGRLLVVCGTYSIGKELICLGIARALNCKIFAPARKMRICAALEDEELMSRMTSDPREAQIHMQMLMEIRPETLQEYLNSYKPHFSRIVGFRPSGWTYKPPSSRAIQSATVPQILTSPSWRSSFSLSDLTPQRGSTREASCFGVPYSEHSSFRELALFVCALRIEKIIPTVNIGSAPGRAKMQAWIDKWQAERRKNGPIKIGDAESEVQW